MRRKRKGRRREKEGEEEPDSGRWSRNLDVKLELERVGRERDGSLGGESQRHVYPRAETGRWFGVRTRASRSLIVAPWRKKTDMQLGGEKRGEKRSRGTRCTYR